MELLPSPTAWSVLEEAKKLGASFADIFVEDHMRNNISILGGKVHEVDSGIDFGIGIRLVFGTQVFYGHTNHKDLDELIRITRDIAAVKAKNVDSFSLPQFHYQQTTNIHDAKYVLGSDYPQEKKAQYLLKIGNQILQESEKITQARAFLGERLQKVEIFNTDGLHARDQRQYCRIMAQAIAQDGSERTDGYEAPGAFSGFEFSESIDPTELAQIVAAQALTKLSAKPCPVGKMPVIIDNGFGGVIFHEACGHLLETTSVAKKASVFHDKMDQKIASDCVSAVDDGTMANYWGSINIDDEGTPTQRTQLIKDGVLTSFLVDKVGALKTGYHPTGSGRRQNYKFPPASRMRNTFIEPGKSSLDEMIASIDEGIYCKKMGGGSVSPGTGEFNFAAQESYLIKKGKIDSPLKSATLIGTGPEILNKITMVGDQLALSAGMCGSVSGAVPTTVGQPAIKVDNILVGGQNS